MKYQSRSLKRRSLHRDTALNLSLRTARVARVARVARARTVKVARVARTVKVAKTAKTAKSAIHHHSRKIKTARKINLNGKLNYFSIADIAAYMDKHKMVFPPTILYTFANDVETRAYLGLGHPVMTSVTVNAYCAASNILLNDYIKNILKTKAEMRVDDINREAVNDALRKITKNTTPKKTIVSMSPIIDDKRVSGLGGGGPPPPHNSPASHPHTPHNSPASPVPPPPPPHNSPVASPPPFLSLKSLVQYDKYLSFCDLSSTAQHNNWSKIVGDFFKHIIYNQKYVINPDGGRLVQDEKSFQDTRDYVFEIAFSYHLSHPRGDQPVTLTAPPPGFIKLAGAYDEAKRIFGRFSGVVESAIFICAQPLNMLGLIEQPKPRDKPVHTALKIKFSDLFGSYRPISDIDKRHMLHSLLLFMVIHMPVSELIAIINILYQDHPTYFTDAIERTNAFLRKEFNDVLPHCLFVNTYTENGVNIPITLLNHNCFIHYYDEDEETRTRVDTRQTYEAIVGYLYNKLIGNASKVFTFDIGNSLTDYNSNHSVIVINREPIEKYAKFTFYINDDPVTFIPDGIGGIKNGKGIIVNRNNIALFYSREAHNRNMIDAFNIQYTSPGNISSNYRNSVLLGTVAPKNYLYYNKTSRVVDYKDRLMGHLAALVYYPNDVVTKLSNEMFQGKPDYTYIGAFDDDPSYPMAMLEGGNSKLFVTYSRIHAWMKRTLTGFDVYVVTRGSKTGYDWHDADADIVSGYLNSDRSLKCSIVLKQVMTEIERILVLNRVDVRNKTMQIFSVGHSLGGYLSLAISHASVSRNIVSAISNPKFTGGDYNNSENPRMTINPYIIPIVFDPFITSDAIIKSFSMLPYMRIHCVVSPRISTFDLPVVRAITRYPEVMPQFMAKYMPNIVAKGVVEGAKFMMKSKWSTWSSVLAASGTVAVSATAFGSSWITKNRYTDPACKVFVTYLKTQQSAGAFNIYEYVNASSDPIISNISSTSAADDIRAAHHLDQINGLCISYLASHMHTDFYIKIPRSIYDNMNQNMKAANYVFNLPPNENDIQNVTAPDVPVSQADYTTFCITQVRDDIDRI
jgi:hypothetical protein